MRINAEYIDNQFLANAVGIESYAESVKTGAAKPAASPVRAIGKLKKQFATETIERIAQTLNRKYRVGYSQSKGFGMEAKDRAYEIDTQDAITRMATESITNEAEYKLLPNEVRERLKPLKMEYDKLQKKLAGMESDDANRFATKWALGQHKAAMESILFNMISGVEQMMRDGSVDSNGVGTEDVGRYQFAVYYPVYETTTQWINCASTVYPKLVKVKDFANLVTSIPVHFMKVEAEFRDEAGKIIDRMPREALYSKFIPKNANAYQSNTKVLVLKKNDFNKQIDLHADTVEGMTAPFLGPLEYVRSDFYVSRIKFTDGTETGKLYDFRSGTALTETMHEIDRKGKVFEIVPEGAGKGEFYSLALYFDGIRHIIKAFYQKQGGSLQEIDEIEFTFKGNDVNLQYKSNISFNIFDEQTFLDAGAEITYQIPVNVDEYAFIDGRKDGNYLTQQMNATAEYEAHQKESIFFAGANEMIAEIRKEYEIERELDPEDYLREGKGNVLYAYQEYDLQTRDAIRKEENLNFALAPTFDSLRAKLDYAANSKMHTQLNMLCSSLSLGVLQSAHKMIVGSVDEATNGKFLGVAQTARTYVMTVGSLASGEAVNAVVVGSDKADIKPVGYDMGAPIPTQDIEYKFVAFPTFFDGNMETFFFNQTATRITNTGDIRLNINPLLPGMMLKTSGKFQVIRKAAAEVVIKGANIRYV